jgi:chitosanase
MAGRLILCTLVAALASLSACGVAPSGLPSATVAARGSALTAHRAVIQPGSHLALTLGIMTPEQKHRAEMLTSLFENDTLVLQYGYAEALGDGRGITAGRAGFTSANGDMLEVVTTYTQRVPHNPLAGYLPVLKKLAAAQSASVVGLDGLIRAWGRAAKDAVFRQVQDEAVDADYYAPAMGHAQAIGIQSALGEAILYDSIIQHGDGPDLDGLPALIARTNALPVLRTAKGLDEAKWLTQFLAVRRADLAYAYDPDTREAWAESVTRVDALASILVQGNMTLAGPIHLAAGGYDCVIP